jgi:hypothetical protein
MDTDFGDLTTFDGLVRFVVARGGCAEEDVRLLAKSMLDGEHFGRRLTPEGCWYKIDEFGFLEKAGVPPKGARWGWVTREGKFWSAAHGAHERLLDILGLDVVEIERAGWVRISQNGVRCAYRMSRAQRRQVETCGYRIDEAEERQKPAWTAPEQAPAPR